MKFLVIFILVSFVNGNVISTSKAPKIIKEESTEEELPPPINPPNPHKVVSLDDIDTMILNSKKPIYKTNVLYCSNNKYYPIERFKVTESEYNCNDKFLEIHFEYLDPKLKIHKGYFTNDSDTAYCVQEHQERSSVCKKIKRYIKNLSLMIDFIINRLKKLKFI